MWLVDFESNEPVRPRITDFFYMKPFIIAGPDYMVQKYTFFITNFLVFRFSVQKFRYLACFAIRREIVHSSPYEICGGGILASYVCPIECFRYRGALYRIFTLHRGTNATKIMILNRINSRCIYMRRELICFPILELRAMVRKVMSRKIFLTLQYYRVCYNFSVYCPWQLQCSVVGTVQQYCHMLSRH